MGFRRDGIIASMELSALGEFGLIDLIKEATASEYARRPPSQALQRLRIGIGDDTAAWTCSPALQLATIDTLVEDVHFTFANCSWSDLGYKSLAVNLSDIAAMGGRPLYALVALSCPGDVDSELVLGYVQEMLALASRHGVILAGGNLASSEQVCSTVTVIGEVDEHRVMRRSMARVGQAIVVTGLLGAAAAAVASLKGPPGSHVPLPLLHSLCRPSPRIDEGVALSEAGITCAIDISDGLVSDLGHVCAASEVSAIVRASEIPLHPSCRDVSTEPLTHALWGGEDYELLVACAPEKVHPLRETLSCPLAVVGEFVPSAEAHEVRVLNADGSALRTTRAGWDHFST